MDVMTLDDYNARLDELNNPETSHERRADVMLEIREAYSNTFEGHTNLTETNTKLQAENKDLLLTNSKYFRMLGVQNNGGDSNSEDETKPPKLSDLEGELNING